MEKYLFKLLPTLKNFLGVNHFQIFIEFVKILLLFWLWCMWDLSSPTRGPTHTPALEVKVNHWKTTGKPGKSLLPTLTKLFVCLLFTYKSYIYKSLIRHMVWYICSHSVGFSFYFLLDIMWSTKISNYSFSGFPRIF